MRAYRHVLDIFGCHFSAEVERRPLLLSLEVLVEHDISIFLDVLRIHLRAFTEELLADRHSNL